ncbi:hypothetical protein K439DRAFT_1648016 [Ramaria rubella]|nr:hypothetical protein K439DRAFT_1648016 [Ramaria rubella]
MSTFALDHLFPPGLQDLYPPTRTCVELKEPKSHPGTLFTKDWGPVPIWTTSLHCRECHTRYHPNYFLHDHASTRTYYPGVPESSLVDLFANLMTVAWVSPTNCARFYNMGFGHPEIGKRLPRSWPVNLHMDCANVWDAFFIHALLYDRHNLGSILELPHHAANNADRAIRATVTDGVTLGHPCCAVHDCQVPLSSQRDVFCQLHANKNSECAVVDCVRLRDGDWRTCELPEHRHLEEYHKLQGKAMFQLKRRLQRVKAGQGHDSLAQPDDPSALTGSENGVVLEDASTAHEPEGHCAGKPSSGNKKIHARFGRRRTHNEELCVATCGVILGRATFFGSEAPNGLFWKGLFPTQASMPHCQFHDNNCKILPMLRNRPDPHFGNTVFPLDVFHFKSKHKESDQFCAAHCNPMNWPELLTADGQWRFNLSAAEQANTWFGGYLAIVRETRVDRYNFFLDEMIACRNEILVKELARKGAAPYHIPQDELSK